MEGAVKTSRIEEITFSADGLKLKGSLHLPTVANSPVIIGCHGLLADRNSPKQLALAEACNQFNMAFFRFDHRGCGQSQGNFEKETSLNSRCRDLLGAFEFIRTRNDISSRIGLFGSSMGGAVCLKAAAGLKPASIVTVAAPIRSHSLDTGDENVAPPIPEHRFFESDQQNFDISSALSGIRNVLMFHGETDEIVPLSHAREIFERIDEPKKLIVQTKGDHRISNKKHQAAFIRDTALWFKQYLLS